MATTATTYKIHPAIGIARLGNSPEEFYLSPETPAALPTACDAQGNPLLSPDGTSELPVTSFKDKEGRIKRQAARFQLYVYDDESPQGRPLKVGDPISGGGNQGTLVDIQWRVYLANKKASWYQFDQLEGEHGYAPDHPRRNAGITDENARQCLIIDPGPRIVSHQGARVARFDRKGRDVYAPTFPPALEPESIDTLGEIRTDDAGRLLVLGGHGKSGTFQFDQFGQPRIDTYANNDGWFDDTSDGPVTARLVMYSQEVGATRFIDVEAPAWVVVGYPRYAPQILDMVTMNEVIEDMAVRKFAARTDLYGQAGTFDNPQVIPPTDREGLILWQAGRLQWNATYRPWFYRDIWPILFRADQFSYLTNILALSNYPHNQSARGNFDPFKLGVPPRVDREALARCEAEQRRRHESGELFVETLAPALELLEKRESLRLRAAGGEPAMRDRIGQFAGAVRQALASPAEASAEAETPGGKVERAVADLAAGMDPETASQLRAAVAEHLKKHLSGKLLEDSLRQCLASSTRDPYRAYRQYLFDLLRQPGEENDFRLGSKPSSRVHGLPLMPLLAGDNPISNTLPSKFLRLTDLQLYLLRQWSLGLFVNEEMEGWATPDPWDPYTGWVNRTGNDLDRGVLSNVLGGAFCPGGEVGWILRNPAVYQEPYRIKADPAFSTFRQTAAQANANRGDVPEADYSAYVDSELSQNDNFDRGMQPGDLTKHMALPWQADFNECTTQTINVTYEEWNQIYPASEGDSLMRREQAVWETLWWPAHRPLQVFDAATGVTVDWSRGIPQTNAGDLKMVTAWWTLPFVVKNPQSDQEPSEVPPPSPLPYIAVEWTETKEES